MHSYELVVDATDMDAADRILVTDPATPHHLAAALTAELAGRGMDEDLLNLLAALALRGAAVLELAAQRSPEGTTGRDIIRMLQDARPSTPVDLRIAIDEDA